MTKQCTKCDKMKTQENYPNDKRNKDGKAAQCKSCVNMQSRIYYKKNPIVKNERLMRQYGINLQKYNELFSKQSGSCALCKKHQSDLKIALSVDHNHETGHVRGLLCSNCNLLLGHAKDNVEVLKEAISYLTQPMLALVRSTNGPA